MLVVLGVGAGCTAAVAPSDGGVVTDRGDPTGLDAVGPDDGDDTDDLEHTFAGANGTLEVTTGPTEVVSEVPAAAFEVVEVSVQETVTPDEVIDIVAEVANVGEEPGSVETLPGVRGPDVDGEETLVFLPPSTIELDPGENVTVSTELGSVEDINGAVDGVEWGPGNDLTAVQQVGENLDPSQEPPPEIADEGTAAFSVVAGQIDGAFFAVSNLDAPGQAAPGAEIDVSATVTNIGDSNDTQDVEFVFDGAVSGTVTNVSLGPGENTTVGFTGVELPTQEDIYEHGVFTADDNQTATVVVGDPEPPAFELSNLTQPAALGLGETITGEVTVTNVGGATGQTSLMQVIRGDFNGDGEETIINGEAQTVELSPNGSSTVSNSLGSFEEINNASLDVPAFEPGDVVPVGFQVGEDLPRFDGGGLEDELLANVTVTGPAFFEVTAFDAPLELDPGAVLDVTATVTNTGGDAGTQTVEFVFDGSVVANQTVTLDAGASQTVAFSRSVPAEPGIYGHGVETANDSRTASVGVDTELSRVAVVGAGDGFGAATLDLFRADLAPEFAARVVDAGNVTATVLEETDVLVFNSLGDANSTELVTAVESDDDTGAVYLDQWGGDSNGIPSRSDAVGDPAETFRNYEAGQGPVEYEIQASHPLFEGVGGPGDTVPVHTAGLADHTWFGGASGETRATVTDQNGSGGPAVAVDPSSGSVLLSSLGVTGFVPAAEYTAEAGQILANAVDVAEPDTQSVVLSNLHVAGEGDDVTVVDGDYDVTVELTHTGGGAGAVTTNLTVGETLLSETVPLAIGDSRTVEFENATAGVGTGTYDVAVSTHGTGVTGSLTLSVDVDGSDGAATDTTGDDLLNDVDGDGAFTIFDVQEFFTSFQADPVRTNPALFDFDDSGDGAVTIFDVQALFVQLAERG
jgi:hypothetical protein